jgi:hypothetical protein
MGELVAVGLFWRGGGLSKWGRVSRTLRDVQVDRCAETSECASTTRRRGTKGKRHAVNSGLTTGRITGNVMHFRSVAPQYTPQRLGTGRKAH